MIAKPKRYLHGPLVLTPDRGRGALWVACHVTGPPSMQGRTIDLCLDRDDLTDLLIALRDEAIAARQTTEKEALS